MAAAAASAQSGRVQPTPTPTPDDDVVKVTTEEIKLNVLAFDEEGAFFRDVTKNDLVITENNVLHQPESVRRMPANVLIIMDTGGEFRSVKTLDRTRRVAAAVAGSLRPDDLIAVMTYADKVELISGLTNDRTQVMGAIKRANFGRGSSFADALESAKALLSKSGIENRHIVLITDGTESKRGNSAKFDALQSLMASDISVHVISYTALEGADISPRAKMISNSPPPKAMPDEIAATLPNGAPAKNPKIGPTINVDRKLLKTIKQRQADLEASQEQLSKLADTTNGEYILPETIDEMMAKAPLVGKMIDASYVVTYMPKIPVVDTRGIAERNISVTSKRDGLIVQARRKVLIDVGTKK